jgi:tryptophan-rich sensory protein
MRGKDRVFQKANSPHFGVPPGSATPWSRILALIGFVGLCLLVALADSTLVTPSLRTWYPSLVAPPGTPPTWVFAPVWLALYVMVGIAGWRVWRAVGAGSSLLLWGWQLLLSAVWPTCFLGFRSPLWGLLVVTALVVLIGLTLRRFAWVDRPAAALLVPYLGWVGYAVYLTAGFWWLN